MTIGNPEYWWLMGLFGIGALVMRGAGCTVNDILDRNLDGQVARTADRPIPSGEVSVRQAIAFLLLQLLIGLAILLQLNQTCLYLGILVLVIVFSYPLAKRVTYWPQFVLGLAFNWGALMGWAAVTDDLSWPPVAMYIAGIAWTLGYDTIYAHQDKEDDAIVGMKSSALALGDKTRPWLVVFYSITMAGIALSGYLAGVGLAFYLFLILPALHLVWQVMKVDINDPDECLAKFKSNRDFGLLILIACIFG